MVEPTKGERGLTERRVGMYTCSKCGSKFPVVISKQRYLIVAEEQIKQIQKELKALKEHNEELKRAIELMTKEQTQLQEAMSRTSEQKRIQKLEAKIAELESYVNFLKIEKDELQSKIIQLSKGLTTH